MIKIAIFLLCFGSLIVNLTSCAGNKDPEPVFTIAGIPDQNVSDMARRYEVLTEYLSEALGVTVEYFPTTDYAATVTAFARGDVQMAWFGGLTGVQARSYVEGSMAIAQRERDTSFHSVFINNSNVEVSKLRDLKGLRFAFGSESSTSGHLMPRFFLESIGINAEKDFDGPPIFSGSHDKTWLMVQGGGAQAGVLSEAVWQKAIATGKVDSSKVRQFHISPPYFDYNWTIRGDVDEIFGQGFSNSVSKTIIGMDGPELLSLFSANRFIESDNANYLEIQKIAQSLGIIK